MMRHELWINQRMVSLSFKFISTVQFSRFQLISERIASNVHIALNKHLGYFNETFEAHIKALPLCSAYPEHENFALSLK